MQTPGPDSWIPRDGVRVCSYCGSVHPDEVFFAIGGRFKVTPTDKSYKLYLELPNPRAGQRVKVGSSSGPAYDHEGKPTRPDLTFFEKMFGRYNRTSYGTAPATQQLKFYFQHFDQAEQARFINLLNAGAMNLAEPGYFYALPFFCKRGK